MGNDFSTFNFLLYRKMPRKLRLSVQRKHQFKKKRSDITYASLIVSIPRDLVVINPQSLPLDAFLDDGLVSLSALKQKLKLNNILPPGI